MKKKELMTLTPAKLTAYMRKMAKKEENRKAFKNLMFLGDYRE